MASLAEVCEIAAAMAADSLPLSDAAALAFVFDPNGDVQVHAVSAPALDALMPALGGEGVQGATVAADAMKAALAEIDGAGERPSQPPPNPMEMPQ